MNEIPARDDAHSKCIANEAQILIAAAEEKERFVAVVQSQGDRGFAVHVSSFSREPPASAIMALRQHAA